MRRDLTAPPELKAIEAVRADPLMAALANRTPAQIETYINATVIDLASARRVLIGLAKAVAVLSRRL